MPNSELDKIANHIKSISEKESEAFLSFITRETEEERKERRRIHEAASKYLYLPIDRWPDFKIVWDFSPTRYHYAFDGLTPEKFEINYPNGLKLGVVNFDEFDSKLAKFSRREYDEIWTVGSVYKVARAILHWVERNRMTPPLIIPQDDEINIAAGHHRVAVCKGKQVETLPVLSERKNVERLERILPSLIWAEC
ncbi:hypothetical protein [Desulfogranum marinum]|uniref:hypothetical protein n=1 Tax=Desulfogranum marinum TaxID=453220 RepID=UPI001963C4F4|nr:hypothetical protein [Desulfogranum marinum]MBM9515047.1 hypothetical protein [Desulfogranum marinum]